MKNLILFMAFFAFLSMTLQSQNDQTKEAKASKAVAVNTVGCQSVAKTTPQPKCGNFSSANFQKYCHPSTRLCKKEPVNPSCRPATVAQKQTETKKSVTEASFSGSLAALCAPFCPPGCCSLPCNTKTQKSEEVNVGTTELVAK